MGTSFRGTWMLKFHDSKRSQRGCKRKLMVNDNLFPYTLLFEPFCLKSGDIFYFSVSVSFSLKVEYTSTKHEHCECSSKIFSFTFKSFMLCLHIWKGFCCNNSWKGNILAESTLCQFIATETGLLTRHFLRRKTGKIL